MKTLKPLAILTLVLAAAMPANAVLIPFDLIGRSGPGMRFDNENPSSASGNGTGGEIGAGISFETTTSVLTLNVGWGSGNGFTNLTGTVTAGHIHNAGSAALTASGGVIISLDGATPGFNSSGTNGGWTNTIVALSAAQATALTSGFLYLNAHTAANGGGEIRGNLVQAPEPSSVALVMMGVSGMLLRRRRA